MKELLPFSCKELHTLYAVKEEIGRGGFGVVYAAKRKSDGVEVAIKEVSKDNDTLTEDNVPLEVALMQQVNDVPGVIKLITYFDTSDSLNSKDLFDFITDQGPLPEHMTREYQLVDTVIKCHGKGGEISRMRTFS